MRESNSLDKTLLVLMIIIFVIGLFCLYSASYNKSQEMSRSFILRQLSWLGIGLLIFILVLVIDYQRIIDMSYILYFLGLAALSLVLVFGHMRLGAQRWVSIGGFSFQPSEFNKIIYIIMMASYL